MPNALRAEWLKLTTTRTFGRVLFASAGFALLAAFIGTAQGPPPWHVSEPLQRGTAFGLASMLVTVVALILGTRTVTEEFAHSTIVHTFVNDPRRRRTMIAKATVAAGAGVTTAVVAAATVSAVTYAMAIITRGQIGLFPADIWAIVGLLGAGAAMGAVGSAVGSVLRQPLGAVLACLIWLFVAENILGIVLGPLAQFLPGKAATAVSAGGIGAAGAAVALGAFSGVATFASMVRMRSEDVL